MPDPFPPGLRPFTPRTVHWGLLKKPHASDSLCMSMDEKLRCWVGKSAGNWNFFITGSLRDLIPDGHVLVKIDQVLDLGWLRAEVADLYCADNGRPGIDPEVVVRLMLAGFLLGVVHDRRLMRGEGRPATDGVDGSRFRHRDVPRWVLLNPPYSSNSGVMAGVLVKAL